MRTDRLERFRLADPCVGRSACVFDDRIQPAQDCGLKRVRRLIERHNDAGVLYGRREAFVAGVIHDGIGVDRPGPVHLRHGFAQSAQIMGVETAN